MFAEQTKGQLEEQGFRQWNASNLFLIPNNLYSEIQPNEEIYSIMGKRYIVVSNDGKDCMARSDDGKTHRLDEDIREGLLAYGVFPSDVKADKSPKAIKGW